jgi:hypothetical protein
VPAAKLTPEPEPESKPEQAPEPAEPPLEDKPAEPDKRAPEPEPNPTPAPAPAAQSPTVPGIPPAVLALSEDELRAAATYYLQKNQRRISQKGVVARQAAEKRNMDALVRYVAKHGPTGLPRLARVINCSPGTTSSYLQRLVKQGRLHAEGWSATRRFSR